ncbi:MAG TPA: phosphoenolpyruvate synthase [Candidatus Paceibacterota bacterium]|nr:phosphoenolpyruvate synthase [Candidatus Paceibacterota bacterium]
MTSEFIRWFSELNKNSGPIAGGKGANLGEMYNSKFPVPPGFAITTKAYYHFIEKAGIKNQINEILDSIDVDNTGELEKESESIRKIIISSEMPQDLQKEILEAYENLSVDKKTLEAASKYALSILKNSSEPAFVAVRSSATTEDLEGSSFAGQQETFLNIKGNKQLIEAVKRDFASLFTARAIYYRKKRGFANEKFSLSVIVQKMINADKSGVMFSRNPVKNNNNVMIEAVYGLGEGIVSGKIKPDNYEVSQDLEIINKKIAEKKIALVRDSQGNNTEVKLTATRSKMQVLEDHEIKRFADYGIKLEKHYGKPQDIEFAVESGELYILQTRPITTVSIESKEKEIQGEILLSGLGASPGVASGPVKIVHTLSDLTKVQKGDVLVTEMTNPDMVVTMQKSAGIVTDEGGITSHAAIVSREMGIPAVVGTDFATKRLKEGQIITVDGFQGKVFEGEAKTQKVEIKPIVETKTKIKVIVDLPSFAERAAQTKCEAVGLLRLEGIIAESGKHPIKFLKENKLQDYTKIIEEGVEKISEYFKEVWIRASDIRTDEFRNLEGAPKNFELNPMLGMHGIRFSLKNPSIFKAELQAIKNCAEKNKEKIFGIMFPQIISVEEVISAKKVIENMKMNMKNIKVGIMVETPAACVVIKDLLKQKLDFISLGTNDLTQYTLAIDRGNEDVQYLYNETNPAVLNLIKRVLRSCEEMGVESSICGQAGSNKEMVKFLIQNNISSISVNADAAYDISKLISEIEENETIKREYSEDNNKKIYENKKEIEREMNRENIEEAIAITNLKSNEQSLKELIFENSDKTNNSKYSNNKKIPEYVADEILSIEKSSNEDNKEILDSQVKDLSEEELNEIIDIF